MKPERIIGLDIGDQWTGVALSDTLKMFARPLDTVQTSQLNNYLHHLMQEYTINLIIVGNPITLKGTESAQTKKVHAMKELLEKTFSSITWMLWDERLTSKQAAKLQKEIKKKKLKEHALAAAIILQSYLDYQSYKSL